MRIGIPKEIKQNENRVAITPAGATALCAAGHQVYVEKDAGIGSNISNEQYVAAGVTVLENAAEVWANADMILKVKEPVESEYIFLRPGLILFAYLHLAPDFKLTRVLLDKGVVSLGYETVRLDSGALPLLEPMSEIAGKMATQIGAQFLARHGDTGVGILLGGVPGVPPASVSVIGGGIVGMNAAKVALGMGARVTIFDINIVRLRYLDDLFGGRAVTCVADPQSIGEAVRGSDLVIGAVLIPGGRTPVLVSEDMVKDMRAGSVLVDVAIDQGGSIATMSQTTSHEDPIFVKHGVIHYAVGNMPGAVPRTSTFALTNVTRHYALAIAEAGWKKACQDNPALARGLNTAAGCCAQAGVAKAQGLEYTPADKLIAE